MTHRGPFQCLTFCDSVKFEGAHCNHPLLGVKWGFGKWLTSADKKGWQKTFLPHHAYCLVYSVSFRQILLSLHIYPVMWFFAFKIVLSKDCCSLYHGPQERSGSLYGGGCPSGGVVDPRQVLELCEGQCYRRCKSVMLAEKYHLFHSQPSIPPPLDILTLNTVFICYLV